MDLEYLILQYFHDFGDANNMFWMAQDEPFTFLLASGEIKRLDITQALTAAKRAGYLEYKGVRKGTIYRLSPEGEVRLRELQDKS